jgi:pimeloyl-ACP methyl ester carboxylesterase
VDSTRHTASGTHWMWAAVICGAGAAGHVALAQQADPATPISDTIEHVAKGAGARMIAAMRAAEAAGRKAAAGASEWASAEADKVADWAQREGEAASRPHGLFVLMSDVQSGHPDALPLAWSGLDADAGKKLPARVVLLVHGLDEEGSIWDELAPALRRAGYTVVKFDYANDQAIAKSAEAMGAAMHDLAGRGVAHVDLVCHSMGGLVARDVLTRETFYAGDARGGDGKNGHPALPAVDRLIMFGTPNAGSSWAHLEPLTEARETVLRWYDDPNHDPRQFLGFLADGRGEAATDLLPGSAFLKDLNARPLPRHAAITTVVAEIEPQDRPVAPWLTGWQRVNEAVGEERMKAVDGALRRASAALGDGVVPVSSAELPGVADCVHICASHRGMLVYSRLERLVLGEMRPRAAPAIPIVLDRLLRDGGG